ncbi:hypothetical protein AK812_SmicGene36443 [Symbiodinium microadriaticum]|uniref:Uncharacterized protein n=1 Tax=Symbiodinium microadriaticum TaxID=2951 RepID=A0A1Q9CIX4_SYMMI|nr:hypothetical protein AK812_SmicGene36443 [Symbiodinium microadriaticum]
MQHQVHVSKTLIPNVWICKTHSSELEAFDASMDRCRIDWHNRPHREATLARGSEGRSAWQLGGATFLFEGEQFLIG